MERNGYMYYAEYYNNTELTLNEKDEVLIDKIAELERYDETFEN